MASPGAPADETSQRARRGFVGRVAELGELSRGLEDAVAGQGRVYLVSGEPGIGKTRLCDELAALARRRSIPVFWGRCWEAGGAPAYWPFLDVIAGLSATLDGTLLAASIGEAAPAVAALVPAIASRLPASHGRVSEKPDEARFRLFRGIGGLLRCASAGGGMVIVLEDLHAADESSLALLHFLARDVRSTRAFLVATFRDVEARLSTQVGEALGKLSREATSLSLARLGEADSRRFIQERCGPVDAEVASRLFRRTQGNPLFLEEMLRLGLVQESLGLAAQDLPAGVRDAIRGRLAAVSSETHAVLETAALAGDEAEAAIVADASDEPPARVLSAFAEASRAGIVVARDRGRFRFTHALFREVLEAGVWAARRPELHAALALALERRAEPGALPDAELAHHLLEAPPAELARAVEFSVRAAERSIALFAFEDAVSLLSRARARVEEAGRPAELEADVLTALGRAHIRRGSGLEGQRLCRQAAELARSLGDPARLAAAALAYGLEITAALVDPVLVGLLKDALGLAPPGDSPLRVLITARLAAAMQPQADLMYPIGLAREAIASARRLGDEGTLLAALFTGMSTMMDIVDARERLPMNLEVEQLAISRGEIEREIQTQARLVFDHMELGDLASADARIDRFERLSREARAVRFLWRVPLFRSMRAMIHGRFQESERLIEEARRIASPLRDPQFERTWLLHREGLLRAWERHEEMIAFDPEARRMRAALYSGAHWQNGGSAFTYARVEDLERARLYLDLVPQDDWPLVSNPPAFAHVGEPLALVGEKDVVRRVYELLLPARDRYWSWGWTKVLWDGPSARVLGLLAARLGEKADAAAHFEAAISRLEALDARPYLARTRYEYGRALLEHGDPRDAEKARVLLESAEASAQALGMSGLVRLAARRLAATESNTPASSAPSPRPTAPPPASGALPFSFEAEGEYWTVSYDGSTFRLRDSLGLRYLTRLFAEPNHGISALTLSSGEAGGEAEVVDAGDSGELLDDAAKASYRQRLMDLREELSDAESLGDAARASRAREEIDFLANELSRAVGLGGRSRRAGGIAERARSAVQRRIKNALDRIREHSPSLADLLQRTVKTGTVCTFAPENAPKS